MPRTLVTAGRDTFTQKTALPNENQGPTVLASSRSEPLRHLAKDQLSDHEAKVLLAEADEGHRGRLALEPRDEGPLKVRCVVSCASQKNRPSLCKRPSVPPRVPELPRALANNVWRDSALSGRERGETVAQSRRNSRGCTTERGS